MLPQAAATQSHVVLCSFLKKKVVRGEIDIWVFQLSRLTIRSHLKSDSLRREEQRSHSPLLLLHPLIFQILSFAVVEVVGELLVVVVVGGVLVVQDDNWQVLKWANFVNHHKPFHVVPQIHLLASIVAKSEKSRTNSIFGLKNCNQKRLNYDLFKFATKQGKWFWNKFYARQSHGPLIFPVAPVLIPPIASSTSAGSNVLLLLLLPQLTPFCNSDHWYKGLHIWNQLKHCLSYWNCQSIQLEFDKFLIFSMNLNACRCSGLQRAKTCKKAKKSAKQANQVGHG